MAVCLQGDVGDLLLYRQWMKILKYNDEKLRESETLICRGSKCLETGATAPQTSMVSAHYEVLSTDFLEARGQLHQSSTIHRTSLDF